MITRVGEHGSHHHQVPPFVGDGEPGTTTLTGVGGKVHVLPTSVPVATALSDASSKDWTLFGATFRVPPAELSAQLRDEGRRKRFAYSAMFRADRSQPGDRTGLGWGGTGEPGPDIEVASVSSPEALFQRTYDTLKRQYEGPADHPEKKKKLAADLHLILGSLLHGPGLKAYHVHWDNADDTTVEAVMAMDEGTGEVRVVTLFEPA